MKKKKQPTIKAYSGLQSLPSGQASDQVLEGCLVLEGGAFRGVYVEGVVDALMMNDINLRATIGCSAGALNGMSYVTGQIGRSARINLGYRRDRNYVGARPFLREGSLVSFRYLYEDMEQKYPLDYDRLCSPSRRFAVVATSCESGQPVYPEARTCSDIRKAVQGSASMPFVSRMVSVDGSPCLDGGSSCRVPYRWALDEGYEKIIVVRTQHRSYRKKPVSRTSALLTRTFYRRYPRFAGSLNAGNETYNRQCEELEELERQGRLFIISPSRPVTVGRLEKDMEKLGELYWLGYHDAQARMDALRSYLSS